MHLWRKQMGVGWIEAMNTPYWVIEEDLEIIGLENKYGNTKPKTKKGSKK